MAGSERFPCTIQSHSTTWHDGSVALMLPNGKIYALASERVGNRQKHIGDSRLAYDYLRSRLPRHQACFGSETDFFVSVNEENFRTCQHHLYHAASTFYSSSFAEAVILVIDGQGPERGFRVATSIWEGSPEGIRLVEIPNRSRGKFIPQSLGHFYTAISALAGMRNLYEEGKTMGLAAYGEPSPFLDCFREYAYSRSDGSYCIDPSFIYAVLGHTFGPRYFGWGKSTSSLRKIWRQILSLRKTPLREADADVTQDDMNIAYAGQAVLEELVVGLARRAKQLTGKDFLCMAGGVALNCAANTKVFASGLFRDVYVFPASDDGGQALGKLFHYIHSRGLPADTLVGNVYLGPHYTTKEVRGTITSAGLVIRSQDWDETIVRSPHP